MADRLVFHVGTPKSGTTYLQSILWENRARLLEHGVLLPGSGRHSHTRARAEIVGGRSGGPVVPRLLREAAEHEGTVLVSDEWLCRADADVVARLVESCEPAQVEVVVTARTLTRVVPAAWQEQLKLGRGGGLDPFVAGLERPRSKWAWRVLDPVEVLAPWAHHLPSDRVHVVVTPPSGSAPDLLWQRFAEAIGLVPAPTMEGLAEANETLGVVGARLLQEIGPGLRGPLVDADTDTDWRVPYRWLRRYVGHDVLQLLAREAIALTPDDHAAVRSRAQRTVAGIESAGWHVLGDLGDLVGPAAVTGRHPSSVTPDELLAASAVVTGRILADLRRATEGAESARGTTAPDPEGA